MTPKHNSRPHHYFISKTKTHKGILATSTILSCQFLSVIAISGMMLSAMSGSAQARGGNGGNSSANLSGGSGGLTGVAGTQGGNGEDGNVHAGGGGGGGAGAAGGDGGRYEGTVDGGTGGAAGTGAGGDGGNGGDGGIGGGGGAGGGGGNVGLTLNSAGSEALPAGDNITGGTGGNGGAGGDTDGGGNGTGSGGGGGGAGASGLEANVTNLTTGATITGGNGGNGGNSDDGDAGFGAAGGTGVNFTGETMTNTGVITGGNGGNGGNSTNRYGGFGYSGGAGVNFSGTTLTNSGTIKGGNLGTNGTGGIVNVGSIEASAGIGVVGSDISIINSGTISGGTENGVTNDAIHFTSGTNNLTLQAGSTITGNVNAAGTADTLILGGNTDSSFNLSLINSQYNGFEAFDKTGTSNWIVTGNYGGSGNWTVSAGTLTVNGIINGPVFTVNNGGRLEGNGRLDDTVIASGGIHAPGSGIGSQTIDGDYTLNAGGILEIQVNSSSADEILVYGTTTLAGTLRIIGLPNNNLNGEELYQHTIINTDAENSIVGTFDTIDNRLAFYTATVDYGNVVELNLTRNTNSLADVADSGNQKSVASVINSIPGTNGDTIRNAILGLTTAEARQAYDQLSGDVHASTTTVNGLAIRQAGQQVGSRLTALRATQGSGTLVAAANLSPAQMAGFAQNGPTASDMATDGTTPILAADGLGLGNPRQQASLWVQAIGGVGKVDGDDNIDATDYDWTGLISGYDFALTPRTRLGVFFGYADGNSKQKSRDARIDAGNMIMGVYGNHDMGDDWRVSGQAGWTRIAMNSSRNLEFGGFDRTATADYTDHVLTIQGEIAKGFAASRDWWIEPFAGLGMQRQYQGSFAETGADGANLSRDDDTLLTGTASTGIRIAGAFEIGDGQQITPQAHIGWEHYIGPTQNSTTLAFDGAPSFSVTGSETDRNTLTGNLGIALIDDAGWSAYADYRPSASENRREHAFSAGFRLQF